MIRSRLERTNAGYIVLFAALYAVQGVVAAYFFSFNPLLLAAHGVGASAAADVQSVALLPFVLKFLAGPFSDRFSLLALGHRTPYIVLGLLVQSVGLVGLSLVEPATHLAIFAILAVLTVSGMALYDTCGDGLVIDVTPEPDRGRVQGILVASRALAAMACSYGFGLWMQSARSSQGSSRFALLLRACAALGIVPLVLAVWKIEPRRRETTKADVGTQFERFDWSALKVLTQRRSYLLLGFGATYATLASGVEIHLSPFYQSLGFGEGTIGGCAALRYVGRALGGVALPLLSGRLGRSRVLLVAVFALSAATTIQAFVRSTDGARAAAVAFGAANGWTDALFYVMAMEASDPRMAASTYALLMAATNVSVAGGSVFTRLNAALGGGFRPGLIASGGLLLMTLVFVSGLGRPATPRDRERLDAGAG